MFAVLFLIMLTVSACAPALAGASPVSTPELDPGSLAALTSGITGAYFVWRTYRPKSKS